MVTRLLGKESGRVHPLAFLIAVAASTPLVASTVPDGDRPIALTLVAARAPLMYQVQGEPGIDHVIGEAIAVGGVSIPVRRNGEKIELDLARDGKFKAARPGPVTVNLGEAGDKKRDKLDLLLTRREDGAWTYRVLTVLVGHLGKESITLVDVDGDGAFNGLGVDGLALGDSAFAFPLPRADERWCTATHDLVGLNCGPRGEDATLSGRPLATTLAPTAALLAGINAQRMRYGLTPRGEDPTLSAPLQKHCEYMVGTGVLAHPEDASRPGYSADGHEAGMASILSQGSGPGDIAERMVATFYHRQDVVRPDTLAFGMGYAGKFGGIDGRRHLGGPVRWPVVVPPPDAQGVPLRFASEAPDPIAGDQAAGFPITVYFGSGGAVLKTATLAAVDGANLRPIDCYRFDSTEGGAVEFNGFQHVVGLIAKEPLAGATQYQVTMAVEVAGTPWTRTWRFATIGAKPAK